eukprot:7313042-Prymnesium_polylepis.1
MDVDAVQKLIASASEPDIAPAGAHRRVHAPAGGVAKEAEDIGAAAAAERAAAGEQVAAPAPAVAQDEEAHAPGCALAAYGSPSITVEVVRTYPSGRQVVAHRASLPAVLAEALSHDGAGSAKSSAPSEVGGQPAL